MKYYAVTEDPRELMHFGIKGMKWGVIRTDAQLGHIQPPKMPRGMKLPKPRPVKSRSDAYKRASAKLSAGMRHGIKKVTASIREYQSPAVKAERRFQKHLQQAREGRLKYKGISDEEVGRITDRLNLERSSRQLSGTEQQSFRRRLTSAVGEGIIRGAGQGTSSYINERMAGRGRTDAAIKSEIRMAGFHNSRAGKYAQQTENKYKNRAMEADARREADREAIKYLAEHGYDTPVTRGDRARAVQKYKREEENSNYTLQRMREIDKLNEQRSYDEWKTRDQRAYDQWKLGEQRSYDAGKDQARSKMDLIKASAEKDYQYAMKVYKSEKKDYDADYKAWKNGGRVGNPPSVPLPPRYEDIYRAAWHREQWR